MPNLAYVNGRYCPIEEATVSVEDRGFQFADGVYEVLVYRGARPVMLEAHLARLAQSCRGIRLTLDLDRLDLPGIIAEGVRRAGFDSTMVYVQLTRGVAPRNHVIPECPPTVVLTFRARPVIEARKRTEGLSVMSLPDDRWTHCDIKSIGLLPNVLAKDEARRRGYDDALLLGPGGEVREATAANLFMIRGDCLITQAADETILPGITRVHLLRCAGDINLAVREQPVPLAELLQADEALLSSTTIDILPVVRVDGQPIGDGKPGRWTGRLYQQMLL